MALVLSGMRLRRVIRGTASYEWDPELGAILRICTSGEPEESPQILEIILQESIWEGEILPDLRFGCDYCINLSL